MERYILQKVRKEDAEEVVIEDGVTEIQEFEFCDCHKLQKIIIPNSVTSIGICAFNGCRSLTSIIIPESITSIGECVFNDCINLTVYTKNKYVVDYCKKNDIEFIYLGDKN